MSKDLLERLHKHRSGKGDLDDEAADRIEQLEAEIERLKDFHRRETFLRYEQTQFLLAASQAREQQLREALDELVDLVQAIMEGEYKPDSFTCQPALQALALPQDTTALEAMIQKAGDVMRERCVTECDEVYGWNGAREAIRTLPGVTLDDLKGGAA